MAEAKPFDISKREVWEAFKRVKANRGVLEMEYLVALGYTPLEAIRSASAIAARAIDRQSDRGVLAAGKRADLLVVDGDAASDVTVLRDKSRIHHLFMAGIEQPLSAKRGPIAPQFRAADWAHRDFAQTRSQAIIV